MKGGAASAYVVTVGLGVTVASLVSFKIHESLHSLSSLIWKNIVF